MEVRIMLLEELRSQVVDCCKKINELNLTTGTSGNVSAKDKDSGLIAITPSGISYTELKKEQIVIVDETGKIVDGEKVPSSEISMHLVIYKLRPNVFSVIHTHSKYCTVLACLNKRIESVHYVIADLGTDSVPVVPYEVYGTKELANLVADYVSDGNALLLANHGMVAYGENLDSTLSYTRTCEWLAEIQWCCLAAGKPNLLTKEEVKVVQDKFKSYGQVEDSKTSYFEG